MVQVVFGNFDPYKGMSFDNSGNLYGNAHTVFSEINYTAGYCCNNIINTQFNVFYNSFTFMDSNLSIEDAFVDIYTEDGDIQIESSNRGLILTSPSGNCFRLKVDDLSQIITEPVNCQ